MSPVKLQNLCGTILATVVLSAASATAATTVMVKFSSSAGNDITAGQATTLGLNAYQNVRTATTAAAGTTAAISVDGITGSATYADFWQANMLVNLSQPYSTVIGGRQIGATGNQAVITLNGLSAWMTANGFTSYELTAYYAGRTLTSENLASTPQTVSFTNTTGTTFDTITVGAHGTGGLPAQWSGTGATQTFTEDSQTITIDYINNQEHGISAIKLVGVVPEPSVALLGGLGVLGLLRRRRA